MLNQDVVRRLSIVATESGLTSVNTKLREHERLQAQVTAGAARMSTATEAADRRMQALLRQRDRYMTSLNAGGLGGVAGRAGSDVGAFAMRNVAPAVAGIAAVVVAYKALNAVWERGAELLEQYTDAQRRFDSPELASQMKSLTKYQEDTISASQVQRASELGMRLQEAKFTIDQFFKVHLDIVDPALKLQAAWVTIVEGIAAATRQLEKFIGLIPSIPGAGNVGSSLLSAIPGGGLLTLGSRGVNALAGQAPEVSQVEALAAAYKNLGAAMGTANIGKEGAPLGGSFAAQWGDYIKQLDDVNKKTKEAEKATTELRTAFDRAVESATKRIAVQEAEAKAIGLGVGAQARFRVEAELTEAALRSKLDPAAADVAKRIKDVADRAAEAATALARARLGDKIKFDRDTMFFTDAERDIAREMKDLYGPEWQKNMDSVEAKQLRINNAMREMRDTAVDFAQTFVDGLMNGKNASEALIGSLDKLGKKMMSQGIDNAVNGVLSGNLAQAASGGVQAAVGWGLQLFQRSEQKRKEAEALAAEQAARAAEKKATLKALDTQYTMRANLAGIDTSSQAGTLAAFDLRAESEKQTLRDTVRGGGRAIPALEKALAAERLKIIEDFAKAAAEAEASRLKSYEDRLFAASLDMSNITDALAAFDRNAMREREEEAKAGGGAMVALEKALAAERINLIEEFNKNAIAAEKERVAALTATTKSVLEYAQELQTGAQSPLSPSARLSAAQLSYTTTRSMAAGGDLEAYGKFTQVAESYRQAAQAMYGSAAGYQAVFDQLISDALGLTQPAALDDPVVAKLQEVVTAIAAQNGLIVTNTGAITSTKTAVDQTKNTITSTSAASDAIAAAQQALQATQNTLTQSVISIEGSQATVLNAIKGLGDIQRQIGNTQGNLIADIGGNHSRLLDDIKAYTKKTAGASAQGSGSSGSWGWLGFEAGGVVGNGTYGRDSVAARYAGGGNIMLAGGEGILTAGATAAMGGRAAIDAINRTGMMPSNDNGGVIAAIDAMNRNVSAMLARIAALEEKNANLTATLIAQQGDWQDETRRDTRKTAGKAGRAA